MSQLSQPTNKSKNHCQLTSNRWESVDIVSCLRSHQSNEPNRKEKLCYIRFIYIAFEMWWKPIDVLSACGQTEYRMRECASMNKNCQRHFTEQILNDVLIFRYRKVIFLLSPRPRQKSKRRKSFGVEAVWVIGCPQRKSQQANSNCRTHLFTFRFSIDIWFRRWKFDF